MIKLIRNLAIGYWIYTKISIPKNTGLGVVDNTNRQVKNGKEYDALFPPSEDIQETLSENTSIHNTVLKMLSMIKKYAFHTEKIAPLLQKNTRAKTLKAVFDFTYGHIRYKLDDYMMEQLRTPARAWADRQEGIDCDCFSIFIGSILANLDIPFSIRITDYGKGYQHVYIVADNHGTEVILDPVIHIYNYEKPYKIKKDYEYRY